MRYLKMETYVPASHEHPLMQALNDAGLLRTGNYDFVYASSLVTGHWRPLSGSQPFIGRTDEISSEPELKLEFRIREQDFQTALKIIRFHHPYEEPVIQAFEIFSTS